MQKMFGNAPIKELCTQEDGNTRGNVLRYAHEVSNERYSDTRTIAKVIEESGSESSARKAPPTYIGQKRSTAVERFFIYLFRLRTHGNVTHI